MGGPHVYPELAAAGLWTTSPDLAKFVMEVQKSRNGRSNKVLSVESTKAMLTVQKSDWSLGFEIGGSANAHYFYHDGANQGYKATLVGYIHQGDGAVILTNGDQGYQLGLEIVRSIAAEYSWPDFHPLQRVQVPISAPAQQRFVGRYIIKDLGDFEIRRDNGILVSEIHAGVAETLLADSDRSFFIISQAIQLSFDSEITPQHGTIRSGTFSASFDRLP